MSHITPVPLSQKKFAEAQSPCGWQRMCAVNFVMRKGGRTFILSTVSQ